MSEYVTADITQGRLRGKRVTSIYNNVTYYSFQGIPYAKPPLGPLRFKPPQDPEPWSGTRDATVEGAAAPQVEVTFAKFVTDEDCLFLNVYTPQLPPTFSKPVMVWIHGGGCIVGSGNTNMYGPDFLVAEDIVLVTINYRIGALGFLHLNDTDITANNGYRDQVMALKWVKNNIAHFGGDPENVTIFGESAGGVSVHYLVLSPSAKGLFHRAIIQSGTALMPACHTPCHIANQRTILLAKKLGCMSEEPQDVADFLRSLPAETLATRQLEVFAMEKKKKNLEFPYFPTEEMGSASFLPASPIELLEEGRFTKVPLMIGVTSAEWKMMMSEEFSIPQPSNLNQEFENGLPAYLTQSLNDDKIKDIANTVKKFYFGDKSLDDDTSAEYIDMMSDFVFVYPMYRTVRSQVRWSQQPTYVFLFDHMSAPGVQIFPNARDDLPGAAHAMELPYLFQSWTKPNTFPPGSPDAELLGKLPKLWAEFAKSGNPSHDAVNAKWMPATKENFNYLKINGGFNMEANMFKHRMDFLDKLYNNIRLHIK